VAGIAQQGALKSNFKVVNILNGTWLFIHHELAFFIFTTCKTTEGRAAV
jgi:hypothetical protein